MTAEKTYQSIRADMSSRIEQKLKELQALTADDIIDMYKAEAEKLSVLDGKYPGTGGIRTFITGRDKFTYDFIDLDQYYIKDEVDEMLEEEKKEREEADDALNQRMDDWEERLDNETQERKDADETLQDNIDKETERAEAAEQVLQDNIDKETERAEAAEQVLLDNIDSETERAEAAEADLGQKIIDEHNLSVSGDDALKVLIEALQDKLIYFDDHFVCKSNDVDGYLNWDKNAGIYIHDYNYGDAWINAVGTDSMPLCFAVTVDGITYQYCIDMKTGYAYYRYGNVGEGSLADIPWIPVDSALLDLINQETSERLAADNRLVDWAKNHFMDTLITIGHAPLTLTVSYDYDSDGYKVYTIDGTVDCYSKGEINELVDNLQQADSLLQSNIDNVLSVLRSDIDNVQSGINNLQSSIQSQIDAITSNYITSIGCDTTSPLFLSASKNGSSVTITGHVDLTDYYTKSETDNILSNYYTKSEVDNMLGDVTSALEDCITNVKASGSGRLTLSASKSGNTVTITGSVTDLSFDAGITSVATKNTSSDDLSNVFSISESTSSGAATISAGINSNNLKSWLDENGYSGGGDTPTTSGVSSVQITSKSLTVSPSSAQDGNVVINLEYTGTGGDVDLSDYQKKLSYYSEEDNLAAILVNDAVINVKYSKGTGESTISFNVNGQEVYLDTNVGFMYNNCEVATQCWVQDYVASTSPGGESVYPTVSTSIPTSVTLDGNKLYTGSISGNTSISFTGSQAGAEVQLIIYALNAATVSFSGGTVTDGYSSISVASGKYLEVNAVYDGNTVYIRSGYSE